VRSTTGPDVGHTPRLTARRDGRRQGRDPRRASALQRVRAPGIDSYFGGSVSNTTAGTRCIPNDGPGVREQHESIFIET
jgi:hypothetical protein